MGAPIAAVAFEARAGAAPRRIAELTADSGLDRAGRGSCRGPGDSGRSATVSRPTSTPADRPEVPPAALRAPEGQYEVRAGTIIAAVLVTGLNSDLPAQLIAQVRESVFDTESGQHLLVPQDARLIGLYDHQVVYGQERVLVSWKRFSSPNGASLSRKDGMPSTDAAGAAGFADQVNHHLARVFGNALLLLIISAGVQLSQIPDFGRGFAGPTAGNVIGAAVGQQLRQTSGEFDPPWHRCRPHARDPAGLRVQRDGDPGPGVPGTVRGPGAPMKLRPVQTYRPALLKGRVSGELQIALTAYAAYYRETTGQTIDLWLLVLQILEQFLDADRDFKTWPRRTQNGPGGGPTKG